MMTTSTAQARVAPAPSLIRAGAVAGALAAVVNLVIFLVAEVAGVPFDVTIAGTKTEVIFVQPLVASFLAVLIGAAVLKLMARSERGVTAWIALAVVAVVLYTGVAYSAAGQLSTFLSLTAMHVVALGIALARLVPVARTAVRH